MTKSLHILRATLSESLRSDPLDGAALALILVTVLVAPVPYGGILPGGTLLVELLAFLAGAAAFSSPRPRLPLRKAWIPVGCLAGIAAVGLLQLVPLPESILKAVSPRSLAVYRETREILTAQGVPALAPTPRVSIAPGETAETVRLTLAYALLFVASCRVVDTRDRRRLVLGALFLSALFQIGYASVTGEGLSRLRGSFVNPNHLAGLLEISLAFAFGLLWLALQKGRERAERLHSRSEQLEVRMLPVSAAILLFGTLAAGIGLTRSRGGIMAAGMTIPILVLLALEHRRGRRGRPGLATTLALAGALAFAASITREGPLLRFLDVPDVDEVGSDGRLQIWRASWKVLGDYPVLGSGLGTFRESFRAHQPRGLKFLVEQAHNEYLQLLTTAGIVGGLLGAVALVAGFWALQRRFFAQAHREESALLVGGMGALLSLLLHGLVEFNFSLPAIPAVLAVALGVAWSSGLWGRRSEKALLDGLAPSTSTTGPATVSSENERRPDLPESGTEMTRSPSTSSVVPLPPSQP